MIPVLRARTSAIQDAALALQNDQLVIFPTETLYGLAAHPFSKNALLRLIEAKNRPPEKGFIVLISDMGGVHRFTDSISPAARILMHAFWPGPLTLVFRKKKGIPGLLTGGKRTIAIRYTSHPVAQALMRASEMPITAPSANVASHPAPRTARAAAKDLVHAPHIALALDSGSSRSAKPSTIVDVSGKTISILREGVITKKRIMDALS